MLNVRSAPFAIAALAVAIGGCGSSSDNSGDNASPGTTTPAAVQALTKTELISRGDALCKTMAAKVKGYNGDTPAEIIQAVGKTIIAYDAMLTGLAQLTPPAELADDYQAWLDENGVYKTLLARFKQAVADNDEAAGTKLKPEMQAAQTKLTEQSRAIGFKTCTQPTS